LTEKAAGTLTNPDDLPVIEEARLYRPFFFVTLTRSTTEVELCRLAAATGLKRPVTALLPISLVFAMGLLL
jgi:hypothetical protein